MATMRWNPLASRWVVLSTARASRPEMLAKPGGVCPFCPGSEAQTTETIAAYGGDEQTWRVRVFRNRYPAFDEVAAPGARGSRGRERPAYGRHEVVVMTPDHTADPADLSDEQMAHVFRALADRMAAHAAAGFAHTQMFVNVGAAAGASLPHPHGQLIATDVVPPVADREASQLRGPDCPLCGVADEERDSGPRLVTRNAGALLVCPYWSEWPFELLVVPEAHVVAPYANDLVLLGVGRALRFGLQRLRDAAGIRDYNVVLHAGPHRAPTPDFFHWHLHVYPRAKPRAGFELASGMEINELRPEAAASRLRAQPKPDEKRAE
ncbi:MAG: hypothetical protein ACM3ZF_12785 [Mycobacterium leprae]